jgi:hypothetical protein
MAALDQASGHTQRLAGLLLCDYAVYKPRSRRLYRLFERLEPLEQPLALATFYSFSEAAGSPY